MTTWVRNLQDHENVPAVWDQFLQKFRDQYWDSSEEQRAREDLRRHRLKWPEIDQYIADFEELARKARYTQGNEETIQLFLQGLPASILNDVLRPPIPATYAAMKERAIDSVRAQQTIRNFLTGQSTQGMLNMNRNP